MCDRIEFKLYRGYICLYNDYKKYYRIDYGSGYDVNTAIFINGVEIVRLLWDAFTSFPDRYFYTVDGYPHLSAGELYENLTLKADSKREIMLKTWAEVKEDEKFVYWFVYYTDDFRDDFKERKYSAFFAFAKEQYYEALSHLQQLIGKDVADHELNKPLLVARMNTWIRRLKEQREEENRRREEEESRRAHKKLALEIKEKRRQAEENGTDVAGAFLLGRLYDKYGDYANADFWYSKAYELSKTLSCSISGDSEETKCDQIKFDLFYVFKKEDNADYDFIEYDYDYLRREGRPHDIRTEIYINGSEILQIMADKWRDKYKKEVYGHFSPWKLFDKLNFDEGFIGGWLWREYIPIWQDGGIVRNILQSFWITRDSYDGVTLMVSEKEDDEFVYWRIINPYEIDALVGYSHEECKYYVKSDTTGENDLFFKFAREQYYAELAKLAKWYDKPEPNRTMWLERLADILLRRQLQRIEEDDEKARDTEMDADKAYEIGRKYYQDEVDPEKALKWFHKAAYLGNTDAMLCIASCYLFGWGMPENKEQALAWFDMAYKLGGGRPNNKHYPGKIPTRGVYADRRD